MRSTVRIFVVAASVLGLLIASPALGDDDAAAYADVRVTASDGMLTDPEDTTITVASVQECGDGITQPPEQCDGADLGGHDCNSQGFLNGDLGCLDCSFDTAACSDPACAEGHAFSPDPADPGGRWICTTSFESALEDNAVFFISGDWEYTRTNSTGSVHNGNPLGIDFQNEHIHDGANRIERFSLPFDTASIPLDAEIIAGELRLKFGNVASTHPEDDAAYIALAEMNLASPPELSLFDYGLETDDLNSPVEGAPRVHAPFLAHDFTTFILDDAGLQWINEDGYTTLGLRMGYDIDYHEESDFAANNGGIDKYTLASVQIATRESGDPIYDPNGDGDPLDRPTLTIQYYLSVCGDNWTDFASGEDCDDGNTDDGDGCSSTCKTVPVIPTASGWGLVVMTLLVLAGGAVEIRRQMRAT